MSLHDITPDTLEATGRLLGILDGHGVGRVQLLVIPGRAWAPQHVTVLREWQNAGHELVGHGWHHRATATRGLGHRLHRLLISRDVAEHLALDADRIAELISRCHAWFGENGLAAPQLYVPPAWAMGSISRDRLKSLPFLRYEILSGIVDAASGRVRHLPLVGFEADTIWREPFLRLSNSLNKGLAGYWRVSLRVAIHPLDLALRLADDLVALMASPWCRPSLPPTDAPTANRQTQSGSA